MKITLYDKFSCLPTLSEAHILVSTGIGTTDSTKHRQIVTEAICTYYVGERSVLFRRNCDTAIQRFEEALSWAIGYAEAFDIPAIHAVFELERPIDEQFLDKIHKHNLVDKRRETNHTNLDTAFRRTPHPKRIMRIRQLPKSMLRRHPMYRYKPSKTASTHRNWRISTLR